MAYILLVDDDKDMAEETAEVLRGAGHEVDYALDTQGGLAKIEQRRPDLLILDVMFPESDSAGFTFAQQLKAKVGGSEKFPILMVSSVNNYFAPGFSTRDIDDKWMPVTDFMDKPVDFDVLKANIASLLDKAAHA